ncbi:MAG TPA: hypothetical protein VFM96_13255 [Gaiellaceae bacterium]|nr:hypothetical protein [Gaiellaceae bacterium]
MPESPEEIAAERKLDGATREVASQELDKEVTREKSGFFGPLTFWFRGFPKPLRWVRGDPVPEPLDDPDPTSEEGLRDALHEHDPKQ